MAGKALHKECMTCNCADSSIKYSDWWYCNNPKDFRDFTVLRNDCVKPIWCPKDLLAQVKETIKTCERQKDLNSAYYNIYWKDHHDVLLRVEKELENG